MTQLIFTREEIEAEHDYAQPHVEAGLQLHGGFDANGQYLSPRTRRRWEAVSAWMQRLEERGVPVLEATQALLVEPNFPNAPQQVLLLKHGIEQGFWDSLTITGIIEGRGRALADLVAPDFQDIIEEDIGSMALGHLNRGLLSAHGWDEGGRPESGLGGHDVMWYAVRDLAFGPRDYPEPMPPARISREKAEREMEQIPAAHEGLISFLMNLLMIEVRAERAFQFYERVLTCDEVFVERREEAARAAILVDRIRQDESVHVAWLRTALSEFRSLTIRTVDGAKVPGADILDPVWHRMVRWHAVEMHDATRESNRTAMKERVAALPEGERIHAEFEALADLH